MLFKAITPLNTALHAARCVWLTGSVPRDALSLTRAVKMSNRSLSLIGAETAASKTRPKLVCVSPVHCAQVLRPTLTCWLPKATVSARTSDAFRYTVCQGVPRCTRPIQPTVGYLYDGKSQ